MLVPDILIIKTVRLSIAENASVIVWIYEIIEKEFFSHEFHPFSSKCSLLINWKLRNSQAPDGPFDFLIGTPDWLLCLVYRYVSPQHELAPPPPPPPPNNPENQNFEKTKKASGDVIILNLCNKKHDHRIYAYSDM